MGNHVRITCAKCGRTGLKIRAEHLGCQVRCKHCGEVFPATAESDTSGAAQGGGVGVSLPEDESARLQDEQLRAHVRGLQDELGAAREQVRVGSVGQAEAEARHAAEIARLEEELRTGREQLMQGRQEMDCVAVALKAAEEVALRAERGGKALARERDQALTDRARLEQQVAGLRAEVEEAARHAAELARAAERDALALKAERARGDEAERLAVVLRGEIEAPSARPADQLDRLKQEHEAACAQLAAEAAAARSERDNHADECARLRARFEELARDLDQARRGYEEESLRAAELARKAECDARELEAALALNADLERIERERRAERDAHERAVLALRRDLENALSQAEAERARAAALTETTTDLERRLANTIDDLSAMTELAESAEATATALRDRPDDRNGGAPPRADVARDDDQPVRVEELLRQLQDARQANQRLSALLGVFGMPREDAPQLPARIEPSAESGARTAPSPTVRP